MALCWESGNFLEGQKGANFWLRATFWGGNKIINNSKKVEKLLLLFLDICL